MADIYRKKIEFYNERLSEYENKFITVGLSDVDKNDIINVLKKIYNDKSFKVFSDEYFELEKRINELKDEHFSSYFDYWCYLENKKKYDDINFYIERIDSIEKRLYDMVLLLNEKVHIITPKEFILRNSILSHLVYTNNKYSVIKPVSADSFMFLCQFHVEKTPSMIVNNSRNFLQCFGCGEILNSIEYLKEYEEITEEESLSLLADIYFLNFPDKKDSIVELQEKYVKSLLSDEFKSLLERGYERTKLKDETFFVKYGISKFEQDFETIRRVRNKKMKDYVFEDKPKVYIREK